jgi:hypothetical protein
MTRTVGGLALALCFGLGLPGAFPRSFAFMGPFRANEQRLGAYGLQVRGRAVLSRKDGGSTLYDPRLPGLDVD